VRGVSKREVIQRFVERHPGVSKADVLSRTEEIYNSFRGTLAGIYEEDAVREIAGATETVLDLQAGQNAGVLYNIGVLSGAQAKEQLEREPHTHLLSSVATLLALWE